MTYVRLALLTLLAAAFAGCEGPGKWAGLAGRKDAAAALPPSKAVIVLCDLSESTRPLWPRYAEAIDSIMSRLGFGDAFVTAKITDSSITEPEMLVNASLPPLVLKDKSGNPLTTDNDLILDKARKNETERHARALEDLKKRTKEALAEAGKPGNHIMRTDIMSCIRLAEKISRSLARPKTVLVIFSDMVEESGSYNFRKEVLTQKRISEIVDIEKTNGRLPDLTGIRVYVVAAGGKDPRKFEELQNFWCGYLRAAGADIVTERYGPTLVSFAE